MSKLENEVKEILENCPETRDDDTSLYFYYLSGKGLNVFEMSKVMQYKKIRTKLDIRPVGAVSRARRRIQEHNPELRSNRQKALQQRQEDYEGYALDYEVKL